MCPNTDDTLFTQTYDSYQWYKDGLQILGATSQFLPVNSFNDAGSTFYVAATLGGCTENSDTVLVDGWAFLPPFVMMHGTPAYFGGMGEAYFCNGDSALLELGMPYTESIQWTNGGTDIPGANSQTLLVTQTGNYGVSGAPAVCPDYIVPIGVSIPIAFLPPFVPNIIYDGQDIYTNDGAAWQWYLDGSPVSGAIDSLLSDPAPGAYVVRATDSVGCEGESDTLIVDQPFSTQQVDNDPMISVFPNPAHTTVHVLLNQGAPQELMLTDLSGKVVLLKQQTAQIDTGGLANGVYLLGIRSGERTITRKLVIRH